MLPHEPAGGRPIFEVIDESADWIVVDKPAPLIVHPANRKPEPTLLGGVEHLLAYEIENGACPAIVNRLDRDTSGLVIVAKHTAAARELGMIFERREVEKEYLAIVNGWPDSDEWECAAPILRAGEIGPSPIWVRQIVHPAGKPCLTRFRVERASSEGRGSFRLSVVFPKPGACTSSASISPTPVIRSSATNSTPATARITWTWMEDGWTGICTSACCCPATRSMQPHFPAMARPAAWNGRRHCPRILPISGWPPVPG
jgi:23S rRNA pseudouridine1911/1915/1917 synthase